MHRRVSLHLYQLILASGQRRVKRNLEFTKLYNQLIMQSEKCGGARKLKPMWRYEQVGECRLEFGHGQAPKYTAPIIVQHHNYGLQSAAPQREFNLRSRNHIQFKEEQ